MFRNKCARLTVLVVIGYSKSVVAADWHVGGELNQGFQYNDNIALDASKASVFGYVLAPMLRVQRKSQTLDTDLRGQGDIRIYDDSRWNCENYNIALLNNYRSSKRSTFALNADYSRACTLIQQLADTGLLAPRSQSERYRVAPSWSWRWTPLDLIDVKTSYSQTNYTASSIRPGSLGSLRGNETFDIIIGEAHTWSPRLISNGNVFFNNTKFTDKQGSNQNVFGFRFGGRYLINSHWLIDVEGGPQWVDFDGSSSGTSGERGSSIVVGGTGRAEITYKDKLYNISLNVESSASPSGFGQLQQYTSIGIAYNYFFAKNISANIRGNFLHTQAIGDRKIDFERNYVSTSIGLLWEPIRHWKIGGEYNYTWQGYNKASKLEADSNRILIYVDYEFRGI